MFGDSQVKNRYNLEVDSSDPGHEVRGKKAVTPDTFGIDTDQRQPKRVAVSR